MNSASNKFNINRAMFIACGILSFILLASIISEIITGESLVSNIWGIHCPVFMQAPAVFEIIKIVGFSNVLVGWIYTGMDKKMLGLSHLEILSSHFRFYHVFSAIHIVSTLFCIALSSSGLSESSLISLAIVLLGFIYQGFVLYCIVLSSKQCEKLASLVWQEKRCETSNLLRNLFCLASTFPNQDSKHYQKHLECFCALFVEYTKEDENTPNLKEISEVWDILFKNTNILNNKRIVEDIYVEMFSITQELSTIDQKKSCLCESISGFIAHKMLGLIETANSNYMDDDFETFIYKISLFMRNFLNRVSSDNEDVINQFFDCIQTNVYLLVWIFFQLDYIHLTKSFLSIVPRHNNDRYIDSVVYLIFPQYITKEDYLDRSINIAKTQLNHQLSGR